MKNDDKTKVIFNSTEGKSHLMDYFIDKIEPTNIVIQDVEFELNVDKKY